MMSISKFETHLPDEIILEICHYLSWFDTVIAFYNLNTRLNRTLSGYVKHVSIGNNCYLKQFQDGCFFLFSNQSSLFFLIRTLTISNRGSPLAAKYFLSHIPIQEMLYLEKLTLIELTGKEILSYLDVITNADQNMFQYLITLHIYDPQCINCSTHAIRDSLEEQNEYESTLINRIITGNNYRFKSIMINGDDIYM
jgi:hypothetical protein